MHWEEIVHMSWTFRDQTLERVSGNVDFIPIFNIISSYDLGKFIYLIEVLFLMFVK